MSLFGRQLRDFIPRCPDSLIGTMWKEIADDREKALLPRGQGAREQWSAHARKLPPLLIGDDVMIQNQRGNNLRRWDKMGVVVEVLDHDQYQVRVEGSRKLTLRNRRYLRKYARYQPQPFDVVPVEVEPSQVEHADAPVPAQVVRGHVVGNGRDDDPVRARVVQGPVAGDVPDAERVQPEEVAVEQPADQLVPEPAGAQVQPEVNPVRGTHPDTRT